MFFYLKLKRPLHQRHLLSKRWTNSILNSIAFQVWELLQSSLANRPPDPGLYHLVPLKLGVARPHPRVRWQGWPWAARPREHPHSLPQPKPRQRVRQAKANKLLRCRLQYPHNLRLQVTRSGTPDQFFQIHKVAPILSGLRNCFLKWGFPSV